LDFQYKRNSTKHPKIKYEQTKLFSMKIKIKHLKGKCFTISSINKLNALVLVDDLYSVIAFDRYVNMQPGGGGTPWGLELAS
jgi:hypothetical protein